MEAMDDGEDFLPFLGMLFNADEDDDSDVDDNPDEDPQEDEEGDDNQHTLQRWRNCTGRAFKRVPGETFEKLVTVVDTHLTETNRQQRLRTPVDVAVMFTISILANPDSFRTTASQFNVAKSSIFFSYVVIIKCLRELASRYLRWPDPVERDTIKYQFERRYGYPGVTGCIDGTNIVITAPLEQKRRYVNRHHSYSVIVQAVCDHRKLSCEVFCGQPGIVRDARTFARCPLSRNLMTGEQYIAEDEHLLGDGAYTLMNQVIKPFVDNRKPRPTAKAS